VVSSPTPSCTPWASPFIIRSGFFHRLSVVNPAVRPLCFTPHPSWGNRIHHEKCVACGGFNRSRRWGSCFEHSDVRSSRTGYTALPEHDGRGQGALPFVPSSTRTGFPWATASSVWGGGLRWFRPVRAPAIHAGPRSPACRPGRHPRTRVAGRGPPGSGSRMSTTLASSSAERIWMSSTSPLRLFLHHAQAMAALEAGKHVIVEKPLAMTVGEADELIATARERDRLVVANLMQRYNPLFDAVRRLVEGRVLGEVLHGNVRELRLGREPVGRALVLGPGQERGDLREHGVHFLRPLCGVARGRVGSRRRRSGSGRGPRSRSRSSARSATATRRWSTSIMASTRPGGWTVRSSGWSSSAGN